MSITAATPYLLLAGRAREAIAFYESALGARVNVVQTFGDVDQSCPDALKDRVMHAELLLDQALLFLTDGPGQDTPPNPVGISIALNFDDVDQTRRTFDALAEGGRVIEALMDAPWGATFGVLVDKFGIPWMFNCASKPA